MKIHRYPGYYIAIEGLDGSGSDLVARGLVRKLRGRGLEVVSVKEPSGGDVGQITKKLLLKKKRPISPLLIEFLFAADRADLMESKVIPALKKGKVVVSDRSLWSSIAYRSLELPTNWLLEVNTRFIIPNLTYFIDVDPAVCAKRIKTGKDKIQLYTEEERLNQIQNGYQWVVAKFPYWFQLIEGNGGRPNNQMVEEVLAHLEKDSKFKKIIKNWF